MAGLKPSMCRGLLCRGFSVLRGPTWWCHLAQAVSEEPTLFKLLLFKKESHRANLQRRKHCFKPSLKWRRSCEVDSCEVDHRKIILSHIESNNFHLKKRYRGKANNVYSVHVLSCSVMSDSAIPWTVAHPAPRSMGFSRQEYWSGLPCLPPGELPDPGIKLISPSLQAHSLPSGHQGSRNNVYWPALIVCDVIPYCV